ncbi:hypothetical protein FKP32DRAFT_212371 [Trametes sanguinea]|nr:hypothetical protein FKP32DRAFT_212371 [Trametes sanguinea]
MRSHPGSLGVWIGNGSLLYHGIWSMLQIAWLQYSRYRRSLIIPAPKRTTEVVHIPLLPCRRVNSRVGRPMVVRTSHERAPLNTSEYHRYVQADHSSSG